MKAEEKSELLREYENAVRLLTDQATGLSPQELDFRPKEDYWTIREHVAHVMDCEIFGFTRYRKSIAQANSKVEGFNEELFTANLDYKHIDISKALQIVQLINEITLKHLSSMVEKDWKDFYIDHPERGKDNLESLVKRRISHTLLHVDYIERNRTLYKKSAAE
jgi:hypothetical protein